MSYFPFMADVANLKCLVAGGGSVALRKIVILSEHGANIKVVSPSICEGLRLFLEDADNVFFVRKKFDDKDLDGVAFAVAATGSGDVNERISKACGARGIAVNVADSKKESTFIFPAIARCGDLAVAVSTGGESPAAAAYIKEKIAADMPRYYKDMTNELGSRRGFVLENVADQKNRKAVFKNLLKYADQNEGTIDDAAAERFVAMANKKKFKVGTRGSALALAQADLAIDELKKKLPGAVIEKEVFTTAGDRNRDRPLADFGGRGAFVAEIEDALRKGEIDFAVHSAKDLPVEMDGGLVISGALKREDPRDVLVVLAEKMGLFDGHCKKSALIGTGSYRRRLQALEIFDNAKFTDVRGNVATRLKKLRKGEFDGIILAAAGLKRLGLDSESGLAYRYFSYGEVTPAGGQGIIAIETRDDETAEAARQISDEDAYVELMAERHALKLMDAGCHAAAGVISRADASKGQISVDIMMERGKKACRQAGSSDIKDAYALIEKLVKRF